MPAQVLPQTQSCCHKGPYPAVRNFLRQEFVRKIEERHGKPEVIAGVATGAIGIGILIAEAMGLPFIYIRPEAKGHGRKNKIEGKIEKGQSAVVIEDLISTGNSSLKAIEALEDAEVNIKGMAAIFTYNFESAASKFEERQLDVFTLSDYKHLVAFSRTTDNFSNEELQLLDQWSENPQSWRKN